MQAALRKNAAMSFAPPPRSATWLHEDARTGFEVVYFTEVRDGHHIEGWTTAVEDGHTWLVGYEIDVGDDWVTRSARVTESNGRRNARPPCSRADEYGRWRVNGIPAPKLDGCLDVDLESSAMTNAFPACAGWRWRSVRAPARACRLRPGAGSLGRTARADL